MEIGRRVVHATNGSGVVQEVYEGVTALVVLGGDSRVTKRASGPTALVLFDSGASVTCLVGALT